MTGLAELMRYDGRRVVVAGAPPGSAPRCADSSGTRRRGGRPRRAAAGGRVAAGRVRRTRPRRPASIESAAASVAGPVDALFNVAGCRRESAIRFRVVTINFLGTRLFTEAMLPTPVPPSCACRRWPRRTTASTCHWVAGLLATDWMAAVCGGATTIRRRSPTAATAVQGGHHRLHRAQRRAVGPGESDQLHRAGRHGDPDPGRRAIGHGQDSLDTIPKPLAGSPTRLNRQAVLAFLSAARRPGTSPGRSSGRRSATSPGRWT